MIYLFIHQTALSQYRHFVKALVEKGEAVYFICQTVAERMVGVDYLEYDLTPLTRRNQEDILAADFILATYRAAAVAKACERLKGQGIVPDIIFGHGGWGETLYVKDIYPNSPVVNYLEFFYYPTGLDLGFDPEFDPLFFDRKRLQARNAVIAATALRADISTVPTAWQLAVMPPQLQAGTRILHEGVDTHEVCPDKQAVFSRRKQGLTVSASQKVLTFVARSLEPYRGFPTFMRALPRVMRKHPDAVVLIVGEVGASYGTALPNGSSYKQLMLAELMGQLPMDRIHFCGKVSRSEFIKILQVSTAHTYLTYPLFLSWSCIEAMAAGCLLVGSNTGPVTDVIKHGENGLLVDFFDADALSDNLCDALKRPAGFAAIRARARKTAQANFDLHQQCLPQWLSIAKSIC